MLKTVSGIPSPHEVCPTIEGVIADSMLHGARFFLGSPRLNTEDLGEELSQYLVAVLHLSCVVQTLLGEGDVTIMWLLHQSNTLEVVDRFVNAGL